MGHSIRRARQELEDMLAHPVWVPGSGPGGGVEHEQHKLNYNTIFSAGTQYMIFGEARYAERIRDILLAYAAVYPGLPYAKPYSHNPPAKLFHQILNEHMWLLFTSVGYSCVRDTLSADERALIERNVFEPMVAMFTQTYSHHFDIVHNHGMWACAAVGICGIATQRREWLELAVRGQFGDSTTAGFLAQITQLFSPAGYYEEGPYYQRFAIQPMLMFAEAIERAWPQIGIYAYHNEVIKRGFYAALYPSFPSGALVPLNDAIKPMNIKSLGYLVGASLIFRRYEMDQRLLWLAQQHQQVWLDGAGLMLSDALAAHAGEEIHCEFPSIELSCGQQGDKGAVGILRADDIAGDQAVLTVDYGTHGLAEHAHFDGLTLGLFNRGQEVLRDYGCVRWINVEPKHGGAYLPENVSWAKQTIAHNTVTVDERCQHDGNAERAVQFHGTRLQFQGQDADRQMMSGQISDYTPGVIMRRSVALVRHADFAYPLIIDAFRIQADAAHQYDYALYYTGQIIRTDFAYERATQLLPLGQQAGYQHLWHMGGAQLDKGQGLFSWLQGQSYYSVIFSSSTAAKFIFTRIGANDPNFNLRAESGLVLRTHGQDVSYATVIETHGYFEESTETSRNARGQVQAVATLHEDDQHTVLRLTGASHNWLVGMAHHDDANLPHSVTVQGRTLSWQGAVCIERE
jgi:oligo-alginate lyase